MKTEAPNAARRSGMLWMHGVGRRCTDSNGFFFAQGITARGGAERFNQEIKLAANPFRVASRRYSALNDSIGSTDDARRAGM